MPKLSTNWTRPRTEYPELLPILQKMLEKLGRVEITEHPRFSLPYYTATIRFAEPPKVQDWTAGELEGALFFNSAAGGIFGMHKITVRRSPKPGKLIAVFDFNLSLDSDDLPLEAHSPDILLDEIADFVRKAKVGFCYHFANSFM